MILVDVARRVRGRFDEDSPLKQSCVFYTHVTSVFVGLIVLVTPQELFGQGLSPGSAFVRAFLAGAVLMTLLAGAHWLFQLPVRDTTRTLGFTLPIRWWFWIPLAAVLGVLIHLGVRELNLPQLWPALVDVTPQQLANNQARDVVTDSEPAWLAWTHAAGEEVAFRAPVVAATVYAFGPAKLANAATIPRSRLAVLVLVVLGTTVGFGLVHLDFSWLNVVAASIMGAGSAAVAIVTRSIWPAAALHAMYNTPDVTAALSHLW